MLRNENWALIDANRTLLLLVTLLGTSRRRLWSTTLALKKSLLNVLLTQRSARAYTETHGKDSLRETEDLNEHSPLGSKGQFWNASNTEPFATSSAVPEYSGDDYSSASDTQILNPVVRGIVNGGEDLRESERFTNLFWFQFAARRILFYSIIDASSFVQKTCRKSLFARSAARAPQNLRQNLRMLVLV